ncbi:unnamed protein product [Lactuca virosa]|uniref:Reverse transcriptase domain-containing protein n=1 Tax=Lactuca virosa TaxID=75947 RepID=A0AAU9NYN1_9ASTR|nr:unnamed protein product [Lactuca virosa]
MCLPPSALASTLSSTFKRDVLAHFTPTLILQSTFLQYVIEAEYSILEKGFLNGMLDIFTYADEISIGLDFISFVVNLDLMKGAYVFHLSLLLKYYLKVYEDEKLRKNKKQVDD